MTRVTETPMARGESPRPCGGGASGRGAGRESGQSLLVALIALVLLGAALALVAALLVARMQRVQESARATALLALADAAVAESLASLAEHRVFPGVAPRAFGGGTIESRVTRGAGDGFTLVAEASFRGGTLVVEATGRLTELGPEVDAWRRVPAAERRRGGGSFRPP